MLLFPLLVAGAFSLGVLAANDISPIALNAVRFWIAAAIIGVIVMLRGGVPRCELLGDISCWRACLQRILCLCLRG
jgi:hypothetical protein